MSNPEDFAPFCPKGCGSGTYPMPKMKHVEDDGYLCLVCKLHLKKPAWVHPAVEAYKRDKLEVEVNNLQNEVISLRRQLREHNHLLHSLIEELGYMHETFHNVVWKVKPDKPKKARKVKSKKK